MKAIIDRSGCISCGLCIATCPEVFHLATDGLAEVIVPEVPKNSEEATVEAQEGCPVSVITIH